MKRIYLDYAATTPMDKEVINAMRPYFEEKFGNPGSLHYFGQEALAAVDASREIIAKTIGANFNEIIFTGSATEANNLALRGVVKNFNETQNFLPLRIIVSAIEHESILDTCRDLEREGIEVIYLPVDKQGFVDLKKLEDSLNKNTILVSVMYANNEIGAIQPIAEISKIINDFKKEKKNSSPKSPQPREENFFSDYPLFHTDAVQAFQFLDCDIDNLGVDLMTLSGHKIYGPKGIGALFVKQIPNSNQPASGQILNSIITGGSQEFGLRSGTENVASIAGFAKAVELIVKNRAKKTERIGDLADYFWQELKKIHPRAEINGGAQKLPKLPNILNIRFPDCRADDLLIKFDLNGLAVSSGSACSARALKPSYVLKAIGLSDDKIKNSIRFSFGKFTTKKEIIEALKIIKKL